MKYGLVAALLLGSTLALGFGSAVSAQGDDPVAERINLMRSNGMVMRGAMRASGADAANVAQTLSNNFAALAALFDDPATPRDTLPAAWEKRDQFLALFAQAQEQSDQALAAAQAGNSDAYVAALRAVNQTCSACHADYRR